MKKILIITTVALMALATMAVGQGQGRQGGGRFDCDGPMGMQGHGGKGMHGHGGPGMKAGGPGIGMLLQLEDELELTPAQVDQMKKMMSDFAFERIDRKAELEKAQVKLRMLMKDDGAAETKVNMAIDDVSRFRADMQKMRFSHMKQVKAVLTEEQTEKLETLRKERGRFFKDVDDFDGEKKVKIFRKKRGRI